LLVQRDPFVCESCAAVGLELGDRSNSMSRFFTQFLHTVVTSRPGQSLHYTERTLIIRCGHQSAQGCEGGRTGVAKLTPLPKSLLFLSRVFPPPHRLPLWQLYILLVLAPHPHPPARHACVGTTARRAARGLRAVADAAVRRGARRRPPRRRGSAGSSRRARARGRGWCTGARAPCTGRRRPVRGRRTAGELPSRRSRPRRRRKRGWSRTLVHVCRIISSLPAVISLFSVPFSCVV
jgi:hypothetical protein